MCLIALASSLKIRQADARVVTAQQPTTRVQNGDARRTSLPLDVARCA